MHKNAYPITLNSKIYLLVFEYGKIIFISKALFLKAKLDNKPFIFQSFRKSYVLDYKD